MQMLFVFVACEVESCAGARVCFVLFGCPKPKLQKRGWKKVAQKASS
mgnify:CR=1 FL=1